MKNDIPPLDALTEGINDSDLMLAQESSGMPETDSEVHTEIAEHPEKNSGKQQEEDPYWNGFLRNLETSDEQADKSERLVCRLDRDLADSLDDCVIYNRSRSDMVNAIVRTFFDAYLPQLAGFRREKKSLFANFNEDSHEKAKNELD